MPRVRRRLLNFLTALSLLLCVAAGALWVRSYMVADVWEWVDLPRDLRVVTLFTHRGVIWLSVRTGGPVSIRGPKRQRWFEHSTNPPQGSSSCVEQTFWQTLGFDHELADSPMFGKYREHWQIPCWLPLLAVTPATGALLSRLRRRRRRSGRCGSCGYDLRATPDRCPECGMEAAGVG
jgi:hypothetical protein